MTETPSPLKNLTLMHRKNPSPMNTADLLGNVFLPSYFFLYALS